MRSRQDFILFLESAFPLGGGGGQITYRAFFGLSNDRDVASFNYFEVRKRDNKNKFINLDKIITSQRK